MTTITIYNPSGASFDAPLNKGAKVFRKLGGDYYVELSFNVAKTLDLPKGSYIEISDPKTNIDVKYALKSDASPEPMSGATGYKYVLKFYAGQHEMEHCQVKWQAGDLAELSFRLTTSLKGYAKLIADNMNAYLESDIWAYDESLDDADMQEQSFGGISCWDAINNIATAFGVEWWVSHGEKLTIHFGKCENEGNATEIREGEIVNRFPAPKRGDDSNYGTRFYIFGGTQNVPEDYRGNDTTSGGTTFHISEKHICLREFNVLENPVGYLPYYDVIEGLPNGAIVEKTIILDDIFPKNETTIGTEDVTRVNENIIEGQEPQPVYYIKVANKPTLLSTLGITFTTGALAGRSFGADLVEKNNTYQIKINHITENSGGSSVIAVPNDNLAPKAGDKYILTGVELSNDRIEAAERELWKKGTELARQRANDTNVYDCSTNPEYCHKEEVNLDLGDKVVLKGAHFGETGRKSRVQGYEKLLYAPYVATYNIGDNSVYSRTLKIYKEIKATVTETIVTGNKNITPKNGLDGVSVSNVIVEYAVSDSPLNLTSDVWSEKTPTWVDGKFIWSRTKTVFSDSSSDGTLSSPVCLTGSKGATGSQGPQGEKGDKGETGPAGDFTEYRYAVNTNPLSHPAIPKDVREPRGWSTSQPTVNSGYYLWMTSAKINGDTNNLLSVWNTPVRITPVNGKNGATGSRGPALRGPQDWVSLNEEYQFYSGAEGEPYLDVVFYDNNCYLCKVSHTKTAFSTPDNNSNWQLGDSIDLVATKLLLAEYSVIKNLGVEAIEMYDKNENLVFQARNGEVTCNGGTFNDINVQQGFIGAWTLTKKGLTTNADIQGYSDTISCNATLNGLNLRLGTSLQVYEQKPKEVIRQPLIALDSKQGMTGVNINKAHGIYINVRAATVGAKENIAIDLEGGCIKGLAMLNYVHNLNENSVFSITRGYNNIIITGDGGDIRQVGMPELENRHNGYVIRIINLATKNVSLNGRGVSCFVDNDATAKHSITIASKAAAEFVWVDGLSYELNNPNNNSTTTYNSAWVRYK